METAQAQTPCIQETFAFQELGTRKVDADFSGGNLSSDGGGLLLREIDIRGRFTRSLAGCFTGRWSSSNSRSSSPSASTRSPSATRTSTTTADSGPTLALTCDKADLLGEGRYGELLAEAGEQKLKQVNLPDDLDYKAYAELRYRTASGGSSGKPPSPKGRSTRASPSTTSLAKRAGRKAGPPSGAGRPSTKILLRPRRHGMGAKRT